VQYIKLLISVAFIEKKRQLHLPFCFILNISLIYIIVDSKEYTIHDFIGAEKYNYTRMYMYKGAVFNTHYTRIGHQLNIQSNTSVTVKMHAFIVKLKKYKELISSFESLGTLV